MATIEATLVKEHAGERFYVATVANDVGAVNDLVGLPGTARTQEIIGLAFRASSATTLASLTDQCVRVSIADPLGNVTLVDLAGMWLKAYGALAAIAFWEPARPVRLPLGHKLQFESIDLDTGGSTIDLTYTVRTREFAEIIDGVVVVK